MNIQTDKWRSHLPNWVFCWSFNHLRNLYTDLLVNNVVHAKINICARFYVVTWFIVPFCNGAYPFLVKRVQNINLHTRSGLWCQYVEFLASEWNTLATLHIYSHYLNQTCAICHCLYIERRFPPCVAQNPSWFNEHMSHCLSVFWWPCWNTMVH